MTESETAGTPAPQSAARAAARLTTPARRRRAALRQALADAVSRWAIATAALAAVVVAGEAKFADARDEAPASAPAPAPSPRGDAAEYTVGGFDAEAGWAATPRVIEVRPRLNPRRGEESAAVSVSTFSAEPDVAVAEADASDAPLSEAPAIVEPAPEADLTTALTGGAGADDALPQSPRSGQVGYMVVSVDDRRVIAARNADEDFIPASVAKVPTALYAIDALGLDFQFRTRLIATGPIRNGVLDGDLILLGGGDPTLDSGDLSRLVDALSAAGVERITGRFYYDDRALPRMGEIEPGQPIYASYNPGVSGLSLNFNRVLMRWSRRSAGVYDIEMRAHAAGRAVEATGFAAALLPEDDRALFRRSEEAAPSGGSLEVWSVSARNLSRRGQRWLPVQDPSLYAADTFRAIAAEEGVVLPAPERGSAPRVGTRADGPRILAEHLSEPLGEIVEGMLKYSTNLTAEALGLTSTGVRRLSGDGPLVGASVDPSRRLVSSGEAMSAWINGEFGLLGDDAGEPMVLFNHSGLTAASRMTPRAMTQVLVNAASDPETFDAFYELMPRRTGRGVRDTARVRAKTGTIYYGRGLAGYIECPRTGELYAFAFFNSDPTERAAFDLAIDVHAPGAPRSARAWLNRALATERALMTRWTRRLCG